jgi:predicted Rossmann fold nucleotide-binding protein DprA/Smf involved in DNA uptake
MSPRASIPAFHSEGEIEMAKWTKENIRELEVGIVSGLKQGYDIAAIQEATEAPDDLFYQALVNLVLGEEIDVIVT